MRRLLLPMVAALVQAGSRGANGVALCGPEARNEPSLHHNAVGIRRPYHVSQKLPRSRLGIVHLDAIPSQHPVTKLQHICGWRARDEQVYHTVVAAKTEPAVAV